MNPVEKYARLLNILDLAQQASQFTIAIFDPGERTMQLFDGVHAIMDDDKCVVPKFGILDEFIRYVHPDDWEEMLAALDHIVETKIFSPYSFRAITDNADIKYIRNFGTFFIDIDNREKLLIVSSDITNEILIKQMKDEQQAHFMRQRNMQSLREMLINISHHWRQPLAAIALCAESLQQEFENNRHNKSSIDHTIGSILGEVQFLSGTIDIFQKVTHEKCEARIINIQAEVQAAIKMFEPKLEDAGIDIKFECDDLLIKAEANEITRATYGLIENAYESIGQRKKINPLPQPEISIRLEKIEDRARLSVKDNGIGLSEKIINKIFEPYFTTKFQSRGVGLTLFVTRHVIRESFEGEMTAQDISTGGAEFVITFPIKPVSEFDGAAKKI